MALNSILDLLLLVMTLVAAWFAWRYSVLKRRLNDYADWLRRFPQNPPTDLQDLENLSNAIASMKTAFDVQLSKLNSENARLSTVLAQLTDGVLIADANGQVQFANPAAEKLFESE